jgi:galactokinase
MSTLVDRHREIFGGEAAVRAVRAPGRVNLIGEHTDYTGGWVMPMALDMVVCVAIAPHGEPVVRLWSEQFAERFEFPLIGAPAGGVPQWAAYPIKVIEVLAEAAVTPVGFSAVIDGRVPMGAGLASSAALEVAMALAVLAVAPQQGLPDLPPARLAALCQEAEHRVGVRCGIMDQFISLHGRRGHAILLNCRDLSFEAVPLPADRVRVVVIDSGVRRKLTAAAYNERRSQCEDAAGRLQKFNLNLQGLGDATLELFSAHEAALPAVVRRRCRHVVTENARVLASAAALKQGDLTLFGRLMNESHDSLRDDYEVSGPELDQLVEIARSVPGVLGSRLTGAGFGGCTVSLVQPEAVEALRADVLSRYTRATGLEPRVWVCDAADGAAVES